MALDASSEEPGIQVSRDVSGDGPFSIAVQVAETATGYYGYQWEIEIPSAGLRFDPLSVEEQVPATGLDFCVDNYDQSPQGPDSEDTIVRYGGCVGIQQTSFTGVTTTLELSCLQDGVFVVSLVDFTQDDVFGSTLIEWAGDIFDTTTTGMTIRCFMDENADHDSDGCSTIEEWGVDSALGGDRDALSQWDFFDVPVPALSSASPNSPRDRVINTNDRSSIMSYIGTVDNGGPNGGGLDYDTDWNANGIEDGREYDRTASGDPSKPWRSQAGNGSVSLQDVSVLNQQLDDSCAAPP